LTNIVTNNRDNNVEYEVTFFGEVSDLASKIGGGFLNSLSLSQYNHEKSYINIVNSWNQTLLNGDVIYPLIEWGYDYLDGHPVQNTLALHNGTLAPNGFTSNGKPLSIAQFKPVIRAKVLIDAILKSLSNREVIAITTGAITIIMSEEYGKIAIWHSPSQRLRSEIH
jgi:hypothetical protein